MSHYIHQLNKWPDFRWDQELLLPVISGVRHTQGRITGAMETLGFVKRSEAVLQTVTLDVLKSTEIEGEFLDPEQVRSSVARKLGLDIAGLLPPDRYIDGVVEMILDATQNFSEPLTKERLCGWHAALFPSGYSGTYKITVGDWRNSEAGPMQVVSGAMGKERVHFEAPDAERLEHEMNLFFSWFNADDGMDHVLKSAVAHLWFVTLHPFDDGNGRIARALADMLLTKSDGGYQRFYSMSAQIRLERNTYYYELEKAQRGTLDITSWLMWYMQCLEDALMVTDRGLRRVLNKTKFWDRYGETPVNERQRLMINKLFDGFEGKLNTSKWAKIAKCSADTALRDIQDLVEKNILRKEEAGGRSTSYVLVAEY